MKTSEAIELLATALMKAQGSMKNAPKDSDNPFYKSKYADLATCWDTIRGPLALNGLSVVQTAEMDEKDRLTVTTRLLHASGQWIEGTMSALPKEYTPQALGSAVTYLRRYSLSAIVGLASEDDDGAMASGTSHKQEPMAKAVRRAPGTVSKADPSKSEQERIKAEKIASLDAAAAAAFQPGDPLPIDDRQEDPRKSASQRSLGIAKAQAMTDVSAAKLLREKCVVGQADGFLTEEDVQAIEAAIVARVAELAGLMPGTEVKQPAKKSRLTEPAAAG